MFNSRASEIPAVKIPQLGCKAGRFLGPVANLRADIPYQLLFIKGCQLLKSPYDCIEDLSMRLKCTKPPLKFRSGEVYYTTLVLGKLEK